MVDAVRRYAPKAEGRALLDELTPAIVHLKWRQGLREEERDFIASASMDGDD
ncbi:MAG TPA: hypothetical protein VL361_19970 [Candidatus Limnocylindrales bacterium]|jgi:hypothetical protein|nr:hypothetical protein [Candidatus Limnocylindrales bacterium]